MFESNNFCFAVVPINNLASIRNCHRGERYVLLSPGSYFQVIAYFLLSLTAVSGVGSSPAQAICETSQVLLAGVSGGFPGVLPFRPPIDWLVSMSEIILKGTLNRIKKKKKKLLSNAFSIIFQVYMNILDYANEIIFI